MLKKFVPRRGICQSTNKGREIKCCWHQMVLTIAVSIGCAICFGEALAMPQDGQVAGGQGTISQSGQQLTVNQVSERLAIDWQSFSINKNETVNFLQPSGDAVALNRVLGNNPSAIFGALNANGKVFLLNPNGILFGQTAQVNVGSLMASTLNMRTADFMNGKYSLNNAGFAGSIVNEGNIQTAEYGAVALIAPVVTNNGTISAYKGIVNLTAGDKITIGNDLVTLEVDGAAVDAEIINHGQITADGGRVFLTVKTAQYLANQIVNTGGIKANRFQEKNGVISLVGGNVENSGTIIAQAGAVNLAATDAVQLSGVIQVANAAGIAGQINISGEKINIADGLLDASGSAGGGQVRVGGGWQGGEGLRWSDAVVMNDKATIDVSANGFGDGGSAVLWSRAFTGFYGSIFARGGEQGGNGGRIETSSHKNVDIASKTIDVGANYGSAGQWLIDPQVLNIVVSGGTKTPPIYSTDNPGTTQSVNVSSIEAVSSGTVTLQATDNIYVQDLSLNGGDGAINLQPDTSIQLLVENPLIPEAETNGIAFVNAANKIIASGSGSITLSACYYPVKPAPSYTSRLNNVGQLISGSGDITLYGADGVTLSASVTTNGGNVYIDADADQFGGGLLTIGQPLTSNNGNVTVKAGCNAGSGVTINAPVSLGAGHLNFSATAGVNNALYTINAPISAHGDFQIVEPVTMGAMAAVTTDGAVTFKNTVMMTAASNLVLTGNAYYFDNNITGNNGNITLRPYSANTDLNFSSGSNMQQALAKLSGFGSITVGRNDGVGLTDFVGAITVPGNVSFIQGGSGGRITQAGTVTVNGTGSVSFDAGGVTTVNGVIDANTGALSVQGGTINLNTASQLKSTVGAISISADQLNVGAGVVVASSGALNIDTVSSAQPINVGGSGGLQLAPGYFNGSSRIFSDGFSTVTIGDLGNVGNVNLNSPVVVTDPVLVETNGNTTVAAGATLTDNASAQPITVVAANFLNNSIVDPLISTGSWRVYSTDPRTNVPTPATMAYDFKQYNTNYGGAVSGTGNGLIYSVAPVVANSFSGTVSKVYDGNAIAALANGNYGAVTGAIDGDVVTMSKPLVGTYNNKYVGLAKTVTTTGNAIISAASSAGKPVYGYQAAARTNGAVGVITQAPLTATAVSANNKVYDATTAATMTSSGLTGIIGTDQVAFGTAAASFNTKDVGNAKPVTVASWNLTGTDAGNYALTNSPSGYQGNIAAASLSYRANSAVRRQGQANPPFSGVVNGFIGADNLANATSGTLTWNSNADYSSVAGQYAIAGSGLTANYGNYQFVQATTNATALTVIPAESYRANGNAQQQAVIESANNNVNINGGNTPDLPSVRASFEYDGRSLALPPLVKYHPADLSEIPVYIGVAGQNDETKLVDGVYIQLKNNAVEVISAENEPITYRQAWIRETPAISKLTITLDDQPFDWKIYLLDRRLLIEPVVETTYASQKSTKAWSTNHYIEAIVYKAASRNQLIAAALEVVVAKTGVGPQEITAIFIDKGE